MSQTGTGEGLTDNFIIIIQTGYTILDTRARDGNSGNHETMNVKIRTTNTWDGFRFTKHETFRQQRLSDNEGPRQCGI